MLDLVFSVVGGGGGGDTWLISRLSWEGMITRMRQSLGHTKHGKQDTSILYDTMKLVHVHAVVTGLSFLSQKSLGTRL